MILTSASDTMFSLRWYDAQGCIQSETVNILEELPIFVAFIIIIQRFDKKMWGLSTPATIERAVGKTNLTELKEECQGRFELVGRHTYCSSFTNLEINEQRKDVPSSIFIKSSWVEERKEHKEPEIIQIANDRASRLLPQKYRNMVTNHIPTVITSDEHTSDSTSIIRLLLKRAGGIEDMSLDDIHNHARIQIVLVTKKLQPVQDLAPVDFWKAFWDIARCEFSINIDQRKFLILIFSQVISYFGRSVSLTATLASQI